jgi:hypothetical protein
MTATRSEMRHARRDALDARRNAALSWTLVIASTLATGCTVIRIDGGATVQTQVLPGIAKVVVSDLGGEAAAVSTSGVGLVLGPSSIAVGWMSERVVAVRPNGACKFVLIDGNPDDVRANVAVLRSAGVDAGSICSINTKGKRE